MMINKAWSSFSVPDIEKAKIFYGEVLGLDLEEHSMGMLELKLPGGGIHWIYAKGNHLPADFTVLNLQVGNIDETVDLLGQKGIQFEHYQEFGTDEKGISRHPERPAVAWLKDPFGNILAIMESAN